MAIASSMADVGMGSSTAETLLRYNMDPGSLRPWVDPRDGKTKITVNRRDRASGRMVRKNIEVQNAFGALPYDAWKYLDTMIVEALRPRLRVWDDIVGAGLTKTIPNGLGKAVIQHQRMIGQGNATISMSPTRQAQRGRPVIEPILLPLPIIHGDFSFDIREILEAQNSGMPLDTTQAEETVRAMGEELEDLTIGTTGTWTYGGGTIYGFTNHPDRLTASMTLPTAGGWTPQTTYNEVLAMMQQSRNAGFYGPWSLYFSNNWANYLDQDYWPTYPSQSTLRSRLAAIPEIAKVMTIDRLTSSYKALLWQRTRSVIEAVSGMDVQTVRWEGMGGMVVNYKIMFIKVPRVMSAYYQPTGVAHAGIVDGTAA